MSVTVSITDDYRFKCNGYFGNSGRIFVELCQYCVTLADGIIIFLEDIIFSFIYPDFFVPAVESKQIFDDSEQSHFRHSSIEIILFNRHVYDINSLENIHFGEEYKNHLDATRTTHPISMD